MSRSDYFAKFGLRLGDFTPAPRILPVLTRSPSRSACVWCVATQADWDAAVGCLAVTFAKLGLRLGDFTPASQILPVLTRSPSGLACVWCVATLAEWDAAVGCLAVSIPLKGRVSRRAGSVTPTYLNPPPDVACPWKIIAHDGTANKKQTRERPQHKRSEP